MRWMSATVLMTVSYSEALPRLLAIGSGSREELLRSEDTELYVSRMVFSLEVVTTSSGVMRLQP